MHCHRHVCSHAGIIITIRSAWRKELTVGQKNIKSMLGITLEDLERDFIFTMWNYMIMNVNNASSFLWTSACIFCFFFQSRSLFSSASSHFPSSWLPLCLSINCHISPFIYFLSHFTFFCLVFFPFYYVHKCYHIYFYIPLHSQSIVGTE